MSRSLKIAAFAALIGFAVLGAGILSSCGGGGGSGGLETYEVTVTQPPQGDFLEASPSPAVVGTTITLTVTPASGFTLTPGTLKAVYNTTEEATLSSVPGSGGTQFRFTMPAFDVTVSAAFEALPDNNYGIVIPSFLPYGTITSKVSSISVSYAADGASVTLEVAPEANYRLKTITVTNNETNDPVTLSGSGDGPYTFTMPTFDSNDTTPSGVTVAAEFEPIPKSVKITGFTNANITAYSGTWQVLLLPTNTSGMSDMKAFAASLTPSMNVLEGNLKAAVGGNPTNDPWTGTGPYYIYVTPAQANDHPEVDRYISKAAVSFTTALTEHAFTNFDTMSIDSWIGASVEIEDEQLYDDQLPFGTISSSFGADVSMVNGTRAITTTWADTDGTGAIAGGEFSITLNEPPASYLDSNIPGASVTPPDAKFLIIKNFTSSAAPSPMGTSIVLNNEEGREASLVYADRYTKITGTGAVGGGVTIPIDVTLYAGWNWIIIDTIQGARSGAPDGSYKWRFAPESGTPPPTSPFAGIWKGYIVNTGNSTKGKAITITIGETTDDPPWHYATDDSPVYEEKGTYTYTGTSATMTITHKQYNKEGWQSGSFSGELTFATTVSADGNTLTVTNTTGTDIFTKQGANPLYWAKTAVSGSGNVSVNAAVTDSSGNIYIAGEQTGVLDYGKGNIGTADATRRAFLAKYDSSGTIKWAKVYNTIEGAFYSLAAGNGGIYAAGMLDLKASVVKCNPNDGSEYWSKPEAGNYSHFNAVAVSGTNVYVGGNLYIYDSGPAGYENGVEITTTNEDVALLVKYTDNTSSATTKWATVSSGSGNAMFNAVAVDSSGFIYAAGMQKGTMDYKNGQSAAGVYTSDWNAVIVKYEDKTSAAETKWAKCPTDAPNESVFETLAVDSTGIYAAGYQHGTSPYIYAGQSVSGAASGSNAVIVKYNTNGNAQWAKSTSAVSDDSTFFALAVDSGSVYAAGGQIDGGTYKSSVPKVSVVGGNNSDSNSVLVKYNTNGDAQWAKVAAVGQNVTEFRAVAAGSSGMYAAGIQEGNGLSVYSDGQTATGPGIGKNPVLVKFPK